MQFFIVVASSFIIPYFQIASGTEMILALQVAVLRTNGEGRSDGDVRQMIIFQNGFDQLARRFGVADSFPPYKDGGPSRRCIWSAICPAVPALQRRRRCTPPESGRSWCSKALPACRLGLCRGKFSGLLWRSGKWRLLNGVASRL